MTFYVICHVFLLYAKLAPNVLMVGRKKNLFSGTNPKTSGDRLKTALRLAGQT